MTWQEERRIIENSPSPQKWCGEPYSDTGSQCVVFLREANVDGYDCPCYRIQAQEDFEPWLHGEER